MNNFLIKLKSLFRPKSTAFSPQQPYPLTKLELNSPKSKKSETKTNYQLVNYKHYRKLIGQLARRTIANERRRSQNKGTKNHERQYER